MAVEIKRTDQERPKGLPTQRTKLAVALARMRRGEQHSADRCGPVQALFVSVVVLTVSLASHDSDSETMLLLLLLADGKQSAFYSPVGGRNKISLSLACCTTCSRRSHPPPIHRNDDGGTENK